MANNNSSSLNEYFVRLYGPSTARKVVQKRREQIIRLALRSFTDRAPSSSVAHEAVAVLKNIYRLRRCYICAADYWCSHREPIVDLAEISAQKANKNGNA